MGGGYAMLGLAKQRVGKFRRGVFMKKQKIGKKVFIPLMMMALFSLAIVSSVIFLTGCGVRIRADLFDGMRSGF